MPGFFPGRPGGEHDEPLLDMILERRPIPPGAPPEIHGLAQMLAAVAGPAEPGELTGEAAALAAFSRLRSPAGISPAAPRSARRSLPEWRARGRLPLAAALTAVAAGLGSTAAAYAGVLPGPIQHFAHEIIGAPAPYYGLSRHAPAAARSATHAQRPPGTSAPSASHEATSSVPRRGSGSPRDRHHGWPGYLPGINLASCRPTAAGTQGSSQSQGPGQYQGEPSPTPAPATPGQAQSQTQDQSTPGPSLKTTPQSSMTSWASAWPTAAACPTMSWPGR